MSRNLAIKYGAVLSLVSPVAAYAAVPASVTTALADMQADALTVAGVFLVAIIAVTAFLFMRKGAK